MLTYEYMCTHCNHNFEVRQKISEPAIKLCPQCQNETAVRIISAANFQLKGQGWYKTDFKNKGKPEDSKQSTSLDTAQQKMPAEAGNTSTKTTGDKA